MHQTVLELMRTAVIFVLGYDILFLVKPEKKITWSWLFYKMTFIFYLWQKTYINTTLFLKCEHCTADVIVLNSFIHRLIYDRLSSHRISDLSYFPLAGMLLVDLEDS